MSLQTDMSTNDWKRHPDLTIVTAYFDIGAIQRANSKQRRSPELYFSWAGIFRYMLNPLVVYTDSERFFQTMKDYRKELMNKTKIFLFDRSGSWAFGKLEAIQNIYRLKSYPSRLRNNPTAANYSCVQNAKYEVVANATTENYFNTKYFAWLDVGLFRDSVRMSQYFILNIPDGFNESRISVCEVFNVPMDGDVVEIFMKKIVWVCGCIFVGEHDLVLRYTEQYRRSVEYFLSQNLSNTDEQILYAMYTKTGRRELQPDIELQLFNATGTKDNRFFFLGYYMRSFV